MIKNAIVKFLKKMGSGRNHRPARAGQALFESMEPRNFMSVSPLMGINPQPPLITYDSGGTMNYDMNTKVFAVDATPIAFRQTLASIPRVIQTPKDIKFSMIIDNDGTLLSGVPGHDLIIEGRVDTDGNGSFDMDGVLLTGEIVSYGGIDSGSTDQFDFIFTPTGGILVDNGFYNGKDIGLLMNSLNSFTFVGEFTNSFSGTAEGRLGPINAHLSSISGYTYYDSNNDGDRAGETPIPGTSVRLTGTDISGASIDQTVLTDVNGFYEFTDLREGTYKLTETQPAGYLDGKDTIGTPGGATTNDMFSEINLPGGYDGVENNFGEILVSSISGYVYVDSNDDGDRTGETPIENVEITLTGTDDLGNPVFTTTFTNGTGYYEFSDLRPGVYKITETQPATFVDGKDTIGTPGGDDSANDMFSLINLPAGYNGVENNFGERIFSSISGYVYYDSNNDGDRTGEAPIPGTPVTLTGIDYLGNPVNIPGVTDGTGYYEFTSLQPGIYKLTETQPGGYLDGIDTIGTPGGVTTNDMFSSILLPAGYDGIENNFGEILASSISGYVYYDSNNDGSRAGETPIPGTAVTLTGTDDLGNPVAIPGVTNGAGYYEFTGLRPGTYKLTETQPAGYLDGIDTIGTPGGSTTNDMFSSINLPAGYDGVENNFGEILMNGDIDIEKLVKAVYGSTGGTEGLTPGYWKQSHHFDDWTTYVPSDSYEATFGVNVPGTPSLLDALNAGGGGVNALMRHSTAALLNAAHANLDFLYSQAQVIAIVQAAFVSGDYEGAKNMLAAQNELEGDISSGGGGGGGMGVNDDADTPTGPQINVGDIAMFTYVVTNTGDVELANVVVTDDMGTPGNPGDDFNPAPILDGAYNVGDTDQDNRLDIDEIWLYTSMMSVTAPGQYRCDADVVGTPVAPDGTRVGDDVTDTDPVHYFAPGLVPLSSISGYVYHDLDNDGNFDNSENPIPGTEVRLTGTDQHGHPVSEIAFTNSSGFYQFTDLQPGTYKLTEIQPAGWNDGKDTIGTPGGTTANDMFSNIVLAANVNGVNNNFGELLPPPPQVGTITGRKLLDTTGNGQSADDTGLGDVTIKLYLDRDGNGVFSATADGPVYATDISDAGTGEYLFENLPAGKYFVQEVVPTGYVRTGPISTDHYVVTLTAGETEGGLDFVNAVACGCDAGRISGVSYLINGTTTVTDLRGKTNEGDVVTVTFTVSTGVPVQMTFVSYTAPGATFVAEDADLQEIFDIDTGVFGAGTHTLTVTNPNSYYQIDFVCGAAIDQFGPAGSNIFYTPQKRLLSADNDGTKAVLSNPATLSGFVYNDADNDGQKDAGEAGIKLAKVVLTGTQSSGGSVTLTRYTEPDGSYNFDNLKPGTYKVTETQPNGWDDGKDTVGSRGGSLSNDMIQSISLSAGNNAIGYLFGEQVKPVYQGLSASFWKSSSNFDEWCGYSTSQKFDSIFGCNATGSYTLLEALKLTDSSGQKALLREAVAALLNASNPDITYFYTVNEVISMVKSAIQSGSYNTTRSLLAAQNGMGGVSL